MSGVRFPSAPPSSLKRPPGNRRIFCISSTPVRSRRVGLGSWDFLLRRLLPRRPKLEGSTDVRQDPRSVNFAGWFILEPWVTPSLFAATGASNDGELQQVLGAVAYNERVREHYETFISEADFKRMSAMGLNAVRIPLPWHVFGSQTDRESYISCIDYIDRALEWAEKYEMRVLLDLATIPAGRVTRMGLP